MEKDYNRIYNSDKTSILKWVKCDFCNSDKNKIVMKSKDFLFGVAPGEFGIVKCSKCELCFTNPRFISPVLKEYYSQIVEYDNRPKISDENLRFSIFRRKDILTDYFNYPFFKKKKLRKLLQFPNYLIIKNKWRLKEYIPEYIQNGYILDVGCSYGSHIYHLRKLGWNVKGIELNRKAVEYAKNSLKLDVINCSFEDFKSNLIFDRIYLFMVLEHLDSPKKALQKIFSLLKTNGKLIFSIPDFSGIEVRIFKKYAYTLHLPYHLYHFTPDSIRKYLKEINFKKIKIIHENTDRDLIAPLFLILKDSPNKIYIKFLFLFFSNRFIRKTIIRTLVDLLAVLGITSRMTIIAEK